MNPSSNNLDHSGRQGEYPLALNFSQSVQGTKRTFENSGLAVEAQHQQHGGHYQPNYNQTGALSVQEEDIVDASAFDMQKRKGRRKSQIWSHVTVDEHNKVHCRHCGALIRINFGEKVERLRKHYVKYCTKNPYPKDSKEFEEMVEQVNTPSQEQKRKTFPMNNKTKGGSNRIISYSIGFVTNVIANATTELTPDHIAVLERNGNRCSNWSNVKFLAPMAIYEASLHNIRGNTFNGEIYLGYFNKSIPMQHGVTVPCGLYSSNFTGTCILSDNCYVYHCSMVCNTFVGRNSCLVNCGTITCEGHTAYGTQRTIAIGSEQDNPQTQKTVVLNVNMSYGEVCARAMVPRRLLPQALLVDAFDAPAQPMPSSQTQGSSSQQQAQQQGQGQVEFVDRAIVRKYQRSNRNDDYIRYHLTIICDEVEIMHCPMVISTFVGNFCKLTGSTINNTAMLAHCTIADSTVTDTLMHGSSSITGHSIVNGVLMFPHVSISASAKVSESILGPDSSVSIGECKRSLLGPFVGFHHASLLIATTWPLGRGNIACGATIGANHTGRSNDQECLPGEGTFFGLNCSIRFPFSMLQSPYSMIASNTVCHAQRIAFPFSLLGSDGGSNGNTLRIGWVLWANPYFIERTVDKFRQRRKCAEYRSDFPVYRPAIVDLVQDAKHRLIALKSAATATTAAAGGSELLLGQEGLGAGRSVVPVKDLDVAYDAYTLFVHRYALHGLMYMLVTGDFVARTSDLDLVAPDYPLPGLPFLSAQGPFAAGADHLGALGDLSAAAAGAILGVESDSENEDDPRGQGMGEVVNNELQMLEHQKRMQQQQQQQQQQQKWGQQQHETQHQQHQHMQQQQAAAAANGAPIGLSSLSNVEATAHLGALSFVLDDLRRMETVFNTVEEHIQRRDAAHAAHLKRSGEGASSALHLQQYAPVPGGNFLFGRHGMSYIITDSHDVAIRRHQLHMLMESFPEVDFVRVIDALGGRLGQAAANPNAGMISFHPAAQPYINQVKQLLIRLVDIERVFAENVHACRQKDYVRASEVIFSAVDPNAPRPSADMDVVVERARNRAEDIMFAVQRLVSLF